MRSMLIKVAAVVVLMSMVCVPQVLADPGQIHQGDEEVTPLNDLDPGNGGGGVSYGNVTFMIGHSCAPSIGGARPWILGRARHWDIHNNLYAVDFWHQAGYEVAAFGGVRAGPSRGDARIIIGFGTCTNCYTGMHYYNVPPNGSHVEYMTMS
ncbi:MAG: hypothetical protein Q8S19_07795 [Bacillota bacterium]|nr:hypothetical protein [Bacillota bacterium]